MCYEYGLELIFRFTDIRALFVFEVLKNERI